MHALGYKSAFIFHVLHQNTLIFAWEGGQVHAKTVQLTREGVGKCDAKWLRKCGCRTVPSSTLAQGTRPAPSRTDPPASMCRGFVTESRSPLEPRAPPAPHSIPLLTFPLLPCAFIHFANSVCQIQLHSWLCSTCLFSMPARRSPAPLAPRLRGGGGGGRAGVVGRETGAGCCLPSPYLFKA